MTISVVVYFIFTYIVHTCGISSLQFPSTSWLRYEVAIYSGCVTEPVSLGMEVERLWKQRSHDNDMTSDSGQEKGGSSVEQAVVFDDFCWF